MRRVLFVDDEQRVLDGLRDLLRRHRKQWDMVFALGAEAALGEIRASRFDVVVSDMRMPGMDGAALLARVQDESPGTVRIILSGYTEQEAAMRAVPVAHQFLSKPCDAATIETTIDRACNLQALIGDARLREMVGHIESLPSRPVVYAALMDKLADPDVSTSDIAAVLEQDMALCAKLLQLVNSAFFGLPKRISSLEDAVTYLGFSMIRSLTLSVSVFSSVTPLGGVSVEALQRHALLTGNLARRILPDRKLAEDAFIAGVLHDVGILILGANLPDHLERALDVARTERRPLAAVERELTGVTHAELGAYLLGLWALPYPVVEAVGFHHRPGDVPRQELDLLAVVCIADALAVETDGDPCGAPGTPGEPMDGSILALPGVADSLEEWRGLARSLAEAPVG